MKVIQEAQTSSVPDEGYSRDSDSSRSLRRVSTCLLTDVVIVKVIKDNG